MTTKNPLPQDEPLIPDCCNVGVISRVLVAVNVLGLLVLSARGDDWRLMLQNFLESAILLETISLVSLLLLCNLRRLAMRFPFQPWLQRLLCGLLPAAIAGLFLLYLKNMEWFEYSFPRFDINFAMFSCFLLGLAFQQYFELRARAFSPALGEARLQALQARIRPHFLFNSLNTALALIRTEPRRAELMLEDLADLFRVLMRDNRIMTSLRDELRLCEQYLAIEKIRLGERLQIEWVSDRLSEQEMQEIEIPSLLLQPLLENAVHYGVEPSVTPALIRVELGRVVDKVEIIVTNPYHENANLTSGNQMALENIRQRLSLLYDIEAQLQYGVKELQFEVRLYFPAKR
ncbi:sensor histidine kinase [Undibacterium hunanense]|uniref:sensor histidine kinase n=1 Tax=Undibacterium hunanense TaxID=2762292 RepID=UPI001C9B24B5|nr:histidine kinase [Undibacterium hunanense]